MPKKKVIEETVKNQEVKEVVATEVEEVKDNNKVQETKDENDTVNLQNENAKLQEQLQQMQMMIMQMQANQNAQMGNALASLSTRDEKVMVQSNMYGRIALTNENGTTVLNFRDSGDIVTLSNRVLDTAMKPSTKELFASGLLEFVGDSEKYYNEYGIVKPFTLSEENLKAVLLLPKEEMFAKLNEMTGNKTNTKAYVSVFWNTIRLMAKDIIQDRNIKYIVGEYFDCPNIEQRVEACQYAKEVNYLK